jgi:hypothetical protein
LADERIGWFAVEPPMNEPEAQVQGRLASFLKGKSRDDLLFVHGNDNVG